MSNNDDYYPIHISPRISKPCSSSTHVLSSHGPPRWMDILYSEIAYSDDLANWLVLIITIQFRNSIFLNNTMQFLSNIPNHNYPIPMIWPTGCFWAKMIQSLRTFSVIVSNSLKSFPSHIPHLNHESSINHGIVYLTTTNVGYMDKAPPKCDNDDNDGIRRVEIKHMFIRQQTNMDVNLFGLVYLAWSRRIFLLHSNSPMKSVGPCQLQRSAQLKNTDLVDLLYGFRASNFKETKLAALKTFRITDRGGDKQPWNYSFHFLSIMLLHDSDVSFMTVGILHWIHAQKMYQHMCPITASELRIISNPLFQLVQLNPTMSI